MTYSKPLLGFRRWDVARRRNMTRNDLGGKYILKPATKAGGADWRPGVNKAVCKGIRSRCHPEEVPGQNCHCGYNAWFSLKDASRYYEDSPIIGAIAGAGDAQIHSKGFRCAEAQIVAFLIYPKQNFRLISEALSEDYGVPVFTRKDEFMEYVESQGLLKKKEVLGRKSILLDGRHCLNTSREITTLCSSVVLLNMFFLLLLCSDPEMSVGSIIFSSVVSISAAWFIGGIVIETLRDHNIIA